MTHPGRLSERAESVRNVFVWNGFNKVLRVVLRPLWRSLYYKLATRIHEDGKFSGTSFTAFELNWFGFTGHEAMEPVEEIARVLHRG